MTTPDTEEPTKVEQPARWWEATSSSGGAVDLVVATHQRFAREAGVQLGQLVRAGVDVDLCDVGWVSFGSVLDVTDAPAIFVEVDLPGAPTAMLFRFDAGLVLHMIDRILGGSGAPAAVRVPTELEVELAGDIAAGPVGAVGHALTGLVTGPPRISRANVDPRLVRLVAPRERMLVLRYGVTIDLPTPVEGTVQLCYPEATAAALVAHVGEPSDDARATTPAAVNPVVRGLVGDVEVDMVARLRPSQVAADDLRRLRTGDVLTLDHRRDDAVELAIGDLVLLHGALGRRRRNVAVQVRGWLVPTSTLSQEHVT